MSLESAQHFLLWSLAFNYLVIFIWFLAFVFAHGWLERLHGRWFQISGSTFDSIHYGGMAIYKIGILLFNLAPLVAILLMRNAG